ncbi:unnamed protein product [Rotaria socialis]|uniref:Uncharacterized protein n=1 Tax=Rotaria socialis TaxID=392032 RepID=A0A820XJK2_9BILA|nr:unnamed protein product [Rotaria socialis]CAF3384288.1 unnamed protein product [Rotaria socialis]CAF4320636.1 unnamed protein product [Rotaria socialis]CAF4474561.1 unnamed protein product [Rotaria socialis]CAF4535558.1 unnamed protein product [Rotaria socialis]
MTEKDIQWLTYHCNVEYMLHTALEQLYRIDNEDDTDFDSSILNDCSIVSSKTEDNSNETKFKYLFNFTIYLWALLIIWIIFQMSTSSYYFK